MEKLILVFYVNVGNLSPEGINKYMVDTMAELKRDNQDDIIYYLLPTRSGETKVECINPKLVSEEDYKKAKEALDSMSLKLQEIKMESNCDLS